MSYSYSSGANVFVGSGCSKSASEKLRRANFAQIQAKRAAYLKTPEGIAETAAKQKAAEELNRLYIEKLAEERRIAKLHEQHACEWDEMHQTPAANTTIHSPTRFKVCLQENFRPPGEITAFVLMRVDGLFPQKPYRMFGMVGKHGLKVFLGKQSREYLEKMCPNIFKALRDNIARSKEQQLEFVGFDPHEDRNFRPSTISDCITDCHLSVKITGSSERCAQGEFVLPE